MGEILTVFWGHSRLLSALQAAVLLIGAAGSAHAQVADSQGDVALVAPAAVPLFGGPAIDAAPVADSRDRALDCMSLAIAYEAAGQPVSGQEAVGQVILNRTRDARFPKTVCGVVFQGSSRSTGCQFSFACDGSYNRRMSDTTLTLARSIAQTVLDGAVPDHVAGATHYHADYVLPYWAATGQQVARIGAHIFYRMPGSAAHWTRGLTGVQPEPEDEAVPAIGRFTAPRRVLARHGRRPVPNLRIAQGAAASAHAMFAPWGLAVAAASPD